MRTDPQRTSAPDEHPPLTLSVPSWRTRRGQITGAQLCSLTTAASRAGFDGVSLASTHIDRAAADDMPVQRLADHLLELDLTVPVVEVLKDWATGDAWSAVDSSLHILDVAAQLGAQRVIAVVVDSVAPSIAVLARQLAALCDNAADRGLTVSFEFLPFGAVANLKSAVRLLDAADRDDLGLVIDAWHWFRQDGGPDLATLLAIPANRIQVVQLNDAPDEPALNLCAECMDRLLPGDGAIAINELLMAVAHTGASPIMAAEVFSASLPDLGPDEMARQVFSATRACIGSGVRQRRVVGSRARNSPDQGDVLNRGRAHA